MLVDVRWVILAAVAIAVFVLTKRNRGLVAPIATTASVVGVIYVMLRLGPGSGGLP